MRRKVKSQTIYQNNDEIRFDEIEHRYYVRNRELPSVSSILRPLSEKLYSAIPAGILQKAANRGIKVHKSIEMYELYGIETNEEVVKEYFTQYRIAKRLEQFEVVASELMLTNNEFCGMIDMIAKKDNKLIIIDVKATSKINYENLSAQLAGYYELSIHNGIKIEDTYVLHLEKTRYKMEMVPINQPLWEDLKRQYHEKMRTMRKN